MLTDTSVPKGRAKRKAPVPDFIAPELTAEERRRSDPFDLEEIVQTHMYYRNQTAPPLKEHFKEYPRLWFVDRYYPHAKGGEIYVDIINRYWDEKILAVQIEKHKERAKIMKAAGLRYLYVTPDMTLTDAKRQLEGDE